MRDGTQSRRAEARSEGEVSLGPVNGTTHGKLVIEDQSATMDVRQLRVDSRLKVGVS